MKEETEDEMEDEFEDDDDDFEDPPLMEAISWDEDDEVVEHVKQLIAAGEDVNAFNSLRKTAMSDAIVTGRVEVAKVLLEAGFDPNLSADGAITTPLIEVALHQDKRSIPIAELLIDAGADPNLLGRSRDGAPATTPLHKAAYAGNVPMVQLLVERGANVNQQTVWGTAILKAIEHGKAKVVELLLEAGADTSLRADADPKLGPVAGLDALEAAEKFRKPAIVKLLRDHLGLPTEAPAAKASMADTLDALMSVLVKHRSVAVASLRPGASAGELHRLKDAIGGPVPADLRKLLTVHDGQTEGGDVEFIFEDDGLDGEPFRLISAEESARARRAYDEAEEGIGEKDRVFKKGLVPITSNGGGDAHCICRIKISDLAKGSIVLLRHEESDLELKADSLALWLEQIGKDVVSWSEKG